MKVSVIHLQRGQPRPHAPHTYESELTIEGPALHEEQVKLLVKALVHHFTDEPEDDSMDSHFRPRLRKLERTASYPEAEREIWLARVEMPFCD